MALRLGIFIVSSIYFTITSFQYGAEVYALDNWTLDNWVFLWGLVMSASAGSHLGRDTTLFKSKPRNFRRRGFWIMHSLSTFVLAMPLYLIYLHEWGIGCCIALYISAFTASGMYFKSRRSTKEDPEPAQ